MCYGKECPFHMASVPHSNTQAIKEGLRPVRETLFLLDKFLSLWRPRNNPPSFPQRHMCSHWTGQTMKQKKKTDERTVSAPSSLAQGALGWESKKKVDGLPTRGNAGTRCCHGQSDH